MAIVATGNYVGPGSTFRVVIDLLSAVDNGSGYTITFRRYVQVVAGVSGFQGTNVNTNFAGTIKLYKDGNYGVTDTQVKVPYGGSYYIDAIANYKSSTTYDSRVGYTYYASTPTYTVSYNANGGSGIMNSDTVSYNSYYYTKENEFIRLGYRFVGWNEKPDGTGVDWTDYIGVAWKWTYTKDITLYAQWERIVLTVTFDAETNGGNVEEKTRLVNYGDAIGTLPIATKKNYKLLGWSRNPNTEDFIKSTDIVTESKTVYAIFKIVANCYIKHNGKYVPSMMYEKQKNGEHKTGIVSVRKNGTYKESSM